MNETEKFFNPDIEVELKEIGSGSEKVKEGMQIPQTLYLDRVSPQCEIGRH